MLKADAARVFFAKFTCQLQQGLAQPCLATLMVSELMYFSLSPGDNRQRREDGAVIFLMPKSRAADA